MPADNAELHGAEGKAGRPSAAMHSTDPVWMALEHSLQAALAPRYILLREIGRGGMGAVYLAREPELSRLVAVKVMMPEIAADETARARFLREAQAAASIAHPNVVAIYGVGSLGDGTPYFVMQYVTGENIAARLERDGPVKSTEARRIIGELASALAAAHSRGVVHRDVKPANVLYDQESGRVLITDFGIAAVRAAPDAQSHAPLTMTGMVVGTPKYMSPEQLDSGPANDRSDVYGLGLVAYELLTGDGPFATTSPLQLMAAHLRDTPRRISEQHPDVDPELEELVLACLVKDPLARPSAAEIVRRLGASDVVLEWPAPGLASLQGALRSVARLFNVSSLIIAASFLMLFLFGASVGSQRVSLLTVLLVVTATIGAGVLGIALFRSMSLARRISRAARAGYGWTTIAETLADRRHDTGLLIAGLREYSGLTAAERDRLRRRRIVASVAVFVRGLILVPLVIVFSWLVPDGESARWIAPLVVFGPVLLLAAVAADLRRREHHRVRSARARLVRRRSTDDVSDVLVETWQESLDAASVGQALVRGGRRYATRARMVVAVVAVVLTGMVLCLVPVFYLGFLGPGVWTIFPSVNETTKLLIAETARPLVLAPDSSISPAEAGRAYQLLIEPSNVARGERTRLVRDAGQGPPGFATLALPATLFTRPVRSPSGKTLDMTANRPYGVPRSDGILAYAAAGMTPAEKAWLETLDASPRWALVHRLARARRADIVGARFVLPFPDTLSFLDLPWARIALLKEIAAGAVSRAALYRSRGEPARADTTLREIVTIGFRMIDDAPSLLDELGGILLIGIAQPALNDARLLDGLAEGQDFQARNNAVKVMVGQAADQLASIALVDADARSLRDRLIVNAVTARVARGTALNAYAALALAPCTNVRELMTGPGADVRAALPRARKTLVRLPSEDAYLDLIDRGAVTIHRPGHMLSFPKRVINALARLSGWVLRNPRIPGCMSILTHDDFAQN